MLFAMRLLAVSLLSVLARRAAAQGFGDNIGITPIFDAPPLEDANIGINAFFAVATLIQLAIAISFTFRVRSQHIAPGIAAIVALLVLFIAFVLLVVFTVVSFLTDGFGDLVISIKEYENISTAGLLFYDWSEPAMFLMVAFVIRDRYLTYDRKGSGGENKSGLPLLPFMIIQYFLAFLIVVLAAADGGLTDFVNLSFTDAEARVKVANNLLYALIAFYLVATILLIPMAVVARKKAGSDTIINVTLFAIVPLLLVRAISRMIFVILLAVAFLPTTTLNLDPNAINFASSFVTGIFYFIVVSILCYFFLSIRLWNGPEESGFQQYGGGYPVYQPQPVAQFPGQWGYPGMPPQQQQQQGYAPSNVPYQAYPSPQQGAGGYYPNQQPGQQQYVQHQQQPQQQPSPTLPEPGMAGRSPPVVEKSQEPATQVPATGNA